MTLDLFWNIFVLNLAHARFIGSVTGDGITEKLFFGERFLNWVDCLFFFLPFSSPTQAAGAAKTAGIPPQRLDRRLLSATFWRMITAIPRTTTFSFRRGRNMSPNISHSLRLPVRRSTPTQICSMLLPNLRLLLLLLILESPGKGRGGEVVMLPPGRFSLNKICKNMQE